MTRIVVNPEQLAATGSLLQDAAGEYQAIGARVASCDCGCMPPDVAASVDAVVGGARASLVQLATDLMAEAGGLEARAGIDQNGFTAVGAARGEGLVSTSGVQGQYVTVESYVPDAFRTQETVAAPVVITGGGFNTGVFGDGGGPTTIVVGSFVPDSFRELGVGPQYTSVIGGGGFDTAVFGAGPVVSVGGDGFDASAFGGSPQFAVIGGDPIELGPGPDLDSFLGLFAVTQPFSPEWLDVQKLFMSSQGTAAPWTHALTQ